MTALGIDRFVGRRVGVFGAGREGRAALSRLHGRAELVLVVDDPTQADALALGAEFGCAVLRPEDAVHASLDAVIRSAGVPVRRAELVALRDAGVVVEGLLTGWLATHTDTITVGITGTKGKSTTSTLCHALLTAAGVDAAFGGNIGVPIIELPDGADAYVIEVSSYQASDVRRSPTIGVLSSLDADHLTWHGGIEAYWHDKLNLFAHEGLRHFVTHPELLDHPAVRRCPAVALAAPVDVVLDGDDLRVGDTPPLRLREAFVLPHNARNLALAVRAARLVSDRVDRAVVEQVVAEYAGLPSRLEVIGEVDGVRFVDDALASNPFGSRTGVESMNDRPLVLLAGGEDRDVDIDHLAAALREQPHVLRVVLFSATRARWSAELRRAGVRPDLLVEVDTEDVGEAAEAARPVLQPGTTLLFSPAAPTPRAIGTYADRSKRFREVATGWATPPIAH